MSDSISHTAAELASINHIMPDGARVQACGKGGKYVYGTCASDPNPAKFFPFGWEGVAFCVACVRVVSRGGVDGKLGGGDV